MTTVHHVRTSKTYINDPIPMQIPKKHPVRDFLKAALQNAHGMNCWMGSSIATDDSTFISVNNFRQFLM